MNTVDFALKYAKYDIISFVEGVRAFSFCQQRAAIYRTSAPRQGKAKVDGGFLSGDAMLKRCSKCHEYKDKDQFYKHRKEPDGLYSQCKTCASASNRAFYAANPEKAKVQALKWKNNNREKVREYARQQYKNNPDRERNNRLKREYGISLDDYQRMYKEQGGVCAVCGSSSEKNFHVDHNHKTGEVRGLLCDKCNKALGFVKDDLNIIKRLKRYLNGHS